MPRPENAMSVNLHWSCIALLTPSLIGAVLIGAAPTGADATRASAAATAPHDPIEGYWLGSAGTDHECIEVGLQFRRRADGALDLLLTQPVSNYFGVETGGEVRHEGDRVTHEALQLDLRLDGDRLAGHYPGPRSTATFHRVAALATEPPVPALAEGPGPVWQARLGGTVYASPVVVDGIAYIGTTGGVLNAIDTRNGETAWTFGAGTPLFGAVAVDGDALYVLGDDGTLFKLQRNVGTLVWKVRLLHAPVPRILPHPSVFDWDWQSAQPLVVDRVVYVGTGDGVFHAVAAGAGKPRWQFRTGGRIRTGAALAAGRVYFGSADHFVYALDAASGREAWRADTRAEIDTTPVVHDGKILVGNRGAGLSALDAATGKESWRTYFWGSWVESTPVVHDGILYVGSSDLRRVSAIDPQTGTVRWRSDVLGWAWGTPLVDGDRLHVGVAGGSPYFIRHVAGYVTLDRSTGRMLTRRPLPDTGAHQWGIAGSPAMGDGVVVVATISGSLLGFPLH
jgi:outer membrane protein assembly factor BamB